MLVISVILFMFIISIDLGLFLKVVWWVMLNKINRFNVNWKYLFIFVVLVLWIIVFFIVYILIL